MPRKSKEATAKNREAVRNAKLVSHWWLTLAATTSSDGSPEARFTREAFYNEINIMMTIAFKASKLSLSEVKGNNGIPDYCNMKKKQLQDLCAEHNIPVSIQTKKADVATLKARLKAYYDQQMEENKDDDETTEDTIELKTDEDLDEWIAQQYTFYKESPESNPADVEMHSHVVCLELPQDLNSLLVLKKPISKKMLLRTYFLTLGSLPECQDAEGKPVQIEAAAVSTPAACQRYLMFGYSSDGHKHFDYADKTPLFGHGLVDIKVPAKVVMHHWIHKTFKNRPWGPGYSHASRTIQE